MGRQRHQQVFEEAKNASLSNALLVHFDPDKELLLTCNASPYGIRAVLAHRWPDRSERPIAFTSWTLTPAKGNYGTPGKRRSSNFVWGEEVPLVLIWVSLYHPLRSPTAEAHLWRTQGNPSHGSVSHPAVGTKAKCISVLYRVPTREETAECRCPQPAAIARNTPRNNPWRGVAATKVLGHEFP